MLGWREQHHCERAKEQPGFSVRLPRLAPVLAERNLEVDFHGPAQRA